MFKAQQFIDEITLYKQGASTDSIGFAIETMAESVTFFGRVITEKGREFVAASAVNTRNAIAVLTHYRTDVAAKDEIEWQGQRYEVVGVVNHQKKNETQINA
jgi:SPP1 family predicted phage head-tail adaptor